MEPKVPKLKIPWRDGVITDFAYAWEGEELWQDNIPWEDAFTIDGIYRRRSAAGITLVDRKGLEFSMFLSEFVDMAKRTTIVNGTVSGWWCGCKKGANYSLRYLSESKYRGE